MKRLLCLLVVGLAAGACGDATPPPGGTGDRPSTSGEATEQSSDALRLHPRLELVGLGDIFDALMVTHLAFEAEVFVLPDELDDTTAGDAVGIRFQFDDGRATTRVVHRDLHLDRAGNYRVLVRVRPNTNGTSVTVGGQYIEGLEDGALGPDGRPRAKTDQEPAPSPAEPAPSPAEGGDEPAPTPADGAGEPAPTPADQEGDEADQAPEDQAASDPTAPAEPAPSPAEPAPSPTDQPAANDDGAEPAPTPAEPAPSPARAKTDGEASGLAGDGEAAPVFVRSRRGFDFYAGTVQVREDASELVVTWDVRSWLRNLLAEPLGIPPAETDLADGAQVPGFNDVPPDFHVESR